MWLTECCIRPLHEHELVSLAKRWFRGATIVSFASHGLEGVGVVDPEGQILGNQMQAVVEIPFAGFWNMQGRILHSPWLNDDGFRWSHIERDGSQFVLFDSADRRSVPLEPTVVARVVMNYPCLQLPKRQCRV